MRLQSVTEVTRYIKALLDGDTTLADLTIEGEVSNFQRAASGHCYFTLQDSEATLRCVMWRSQADRQSWLPKQGDMVDAHGAISVYERGGAYQFYVDALRRGGIGARWQEFLAVRARLEAEGLLANEIKRPLPPWPRRIGVVTSPTGAAFRDILKVLRQRYPLVQVVLAPSLVQGEEAPASLRAALEALGRLPDLDVIIIARGGGSAEDLWAFNDEALARAIRATRVPVISGVGHETDFTITDFVADYRAPTPTAAAAAAVPNGEELRLHLLDAMQTLSNLMGDRLTRAREGLDRAERALQRNSPERVITQRRQQVDDLARRANRALLQGLQARRMQVHGQLARLGALDPTQVLQRGYALVQDRESGQRLASILQARIAQQLRVYMADGHLDAQVTELGRP